MSLDLTFYKSKNTKGEGYYAYLCDEIDFVTLNCNVRESYPTKVSVECELFGDYGKKTNMENLESYVAEDINLYEHTREQIIEFRGRFDKECVFTELLDEIIESQIEIVYSRLIG